MPAYAAIPPDDPFAASKGLLDALACELAGPAAAGLTASGLEELLDEASDSPWRPTLTYAHVRAQSARNVDTRAR